MLRLLIDENFDHRILRGLRLQIPGLDYVIVQETELRGIKDPLLLAWAAGQANRGFELPQRAMEFPGQLNESLTGTDWSVRLVI